MKGKRTLRDTIIKSQDMHSTDRLLDDQPQRSTIYQLNICNNIKTQIVVNNIFYVKDCLRFIKTKVHFNSYLLINNGGSCIGASGAQPHQRFPKISFRFINVKKTNVHYYFSNVN